MLANEYRTKPDVNYIRTPDQIDVNPSGIWLPSQVIGWEPGAIPPEK